MPTVLVQTPVVTIDGSPLSDQVYDQLVELRVEQSVSLPGKLTLRMSDPDFALIDGSTFVIGAAIAVSLPTHTNTSVSVFEGEIVSVGIDQQGETISGCELVVTAYDASHCLGHATSIRTFQKQSYADIVSKIAQESGLSCQATAGKSPVHEYVIQTTTNYAFLNELAFRAGCEWTVEGKKLVFAARASSAAIELGFLEELRRFKARYTATDRSKSVTVRGWDPKSLQEIAATETVSLTGESVTVGSVALATDGRSKSRGFDGALTTGTLGPASTAEAQALAKALGTRLVASELSARGEVLGRPDIKAGSRIKIKGMGTRLSGEYYVTAVEHIFGRETDLITRFTAGGTNPASIVDLLGGNPDRVTPFGQRGLCVGIVTNNKDPDNVGRVKVKFPTLSGEVESPWARVVSAGAGKTRGFMVVPEVNDEVLVGFHDGDLRYPYVLGGLWSAKNTPPLPNSEFLDNNKVTKWGMTAPGGHSMQMVTGDPDDKNHFTVKLGKGNATLRLGKDKIEIIADAGKPIELKNDKASIVLSATGDVTIKGNNVTIEAQQAVKVTGTSGVEVKSNTTLKAEAAASMELKANASAKVECSGITQIKGSMVTIN